MHSWWQEAAKKKVQLESISGTQLDPIILHLWI